MEGYPMQVGSTIIFTEGNMCKQAIISCVVVYVLDIFAAFPYSTIDSANVG